MTQVRTFSIFTAMLVLGLPPAFAQATLFNDGSTFGGSQVFSEGLNPLGNSARFDQLQSQPALCLSYADGDQQMPDHVSTLNTMETSAQDPAKASDAIRKLNNSIWGLRTRSYGLAYVADSVNTSYTHEEFNTSLASMDVLSAHLDSLGALASNTGMLDVRRSVVNRFAMGMGSKQQGSAAGFLFRVERWNLGMETAAINPKRGQLDLLGGSDPYQFRDTPLTTSTVAVDFGFSMDLSQGVRLGGMLNRINAKRIWDVEEKPQGRVGLQMDIGSLAMLSIESDVNATMRMPYPVKQRTQSASLRISANPTVTLLLGAERRQIGDQSVTRGGATLQIHMDGFRIGLGMQYCPDKPLKGATVVFN